MKIIYQCEVITPIFIKGATSDDIGIRTPSIKGVMRFWWRALHGDMKLSDIRNEKEEVIKKSLKTLESEIFGGTGEKQGKSKVSIRINQGKLQLPYSGLPKNHKVKITHEGKEISMSILKYLAFGSEKQKYIKPGQSFEFMLRFDDKLEKEIVQVFSCISQFGGLGSKSRNGYGSIQILNINPIKIKSLLTYNGIPQYSAFSKNIKLFKTKPFITWDKALAETGKAYYKARQKLESKHHYEKRKFIGSPITKSILERHAKPYFLKVRKEGKNYIGQILYLPSKYCEGLNQDRYNNRINHEELNEKFTQCCNEFNDYLVQDLEVII